MQLVLQSVQTRVHHVLLLSVPGQLLHVHRDGVQEVARVDHHAVVSLQTDARLKLGIGSHEIKLGVDSHAVLQTGQTDTGVPRMGQRLCHDSDWLILTMLQPCHLHRSCWPP